jgi:hypothetical protein
MKIVAVHRYGDLSARFQAPDPNRFQFVDRPPGQRPVAEIELSCKAFPHRVDQYTLGFRAVVQQDQLGRQPRLRVRVRASNLKEQLEKFLPVAVISKRGDFAKKLAEIQRTR